MDPSQPSGGTEDAVPAEARMARRKSSRNHTLHVPAASPAAAVAAANGGLLNPLPPDAFSLPKRGSIFDTFDDTKSSKETELEKSVKNLREELHASQAFAQSSKARAEALNEQLQKTNENYLKEITRLREEKERSRQVIVELRRDLNMLTTRLGENVLKGFKAEPKKALMSLLSSPEGMKAFKAAIKRWEMMVLETLKNHDADADEDLLAELTGEDPTKNAFDSLLTQLPSLFEDEKSPSGRGSVIVANSGDQDAVQPMALQDPHGLMAVRATLDSQDGIVRKIVRHIFSFLQPEDPYVQRWKQVDAEEKAKQEAEERAKREAAEKEDRQKKKPDPKPKPKPKAAVRTNSTQWEEADMKSEKTKVAEIETQKDTDDEELAKLRERLNQVLVEKGAMEVRCQTSEAERRRLEAVVEELEAEIRNLKSGLGDREALIRETSESQGKCADLTEEINRFRRELEKTRRELEETMERADSAESRLQSLEDEREGLEESLRQKILQEAHQKVVENSTQTSITWTGAQLVDMSGDGFPSPSPHDSPVSGRRKIRAVTSPAATAQSFIEDTLESPEKSETQSPETSPRSPRSPRSKGSPRPPQTTVVGPESAKSPPKEAAKLPQGTLTVQELALEAPPSSSGPVHQKEKQSLSRALLALGKNRQQEEQENSPRPAAAQHKKPQVAVEKDKSPAKASERKADRLQSSNQAGNISTRREENRQNAAQRQTTSDGPAGGDTEVRDGREEKEKEKDRRISSQRRDPSAGVTFSDATQGVRQDHARDAPHAPSTSSLQGQDANSRFLSPVRFGLSNNGTRLHEDGESNFLRPSGSLLDDGNDFPPLSDDTRRRRHGGRRTVGRTATPSPSLEPQTLIASLLFHSEFRDPLMPSNVLVSKMHPPSARARVSNQPTEASPSHLTETPRPTQPASVGTRFYQGADGITIALLPASDCSEHLPSNETASDPKESSPPHPSRRIETSAQTDAPQPTAPKRKRYLRHSAVQTDTQPSVIAPDGWRHQSRKQRQEGQEEGVTEELRGNGAQKNSGASLSLPRLPQLAKLSLACVGSHSPKSRSPPRDGRTGTQNPPRQLLQRHTVACLPSEDAERDVHDLSDSSSPVLQHDATDGNGRVVEEEGMNRTETGKQSESHHFRLPNLKMTQTGCRRERGRSKYLNDKFDPVDSHTYRSHGSLGETGSAGLGTQRVSPKGADRSKKTNMTKSGTHLTSSAEALGEWRRPLEGPSGTTSHSVLIRTGAPKGKFCGTVVEGCLCPVLQPGLMPFRVPVSEVRLAASAPHASLRLTATQTEGSQGIENEVFPDHQT